MTHFLKKKDRLFLPGGRFVHVDRVEDVDGELQVLAQHVGLHVAFLQEPHEAFQSENRAK